MGKQGATPASEQTSTPASKKVNERDVVIQDPVETPAPGTYAALVNSEYDDFVARSGGVAPLGLIIVADDSVTMQMVLRKFLMRGLPHYLVLCLSDGEQVLSVLVQRRALKCPIAIIIADLSMPILSGMDMTRRLREIEAREGFPPLPVLAATASVG